jgi:hypothetical protein
MSEQRVRGLTLRGDEPKRLQLSDGSRLTLDATSDRDRCEWRRLGRRRSNLKVCDALDLAGEDYARYVTVRTRAEVEWLRAVADWYREQADRLQNQLADART